MKKLLLMFFLVSIFVFSLATISKTQDNMQKKGMQQSKMLYDRTTTETLQGEVITVDSVKMTDAMMKMMGMGQKMGMKGTNYGIHVMLKTAKETIAVRLGPAWFVSKQETKILVNDKIEVVGSRITSEEKPALCAAEVKNGTHVLKLRNEDGTPVWAGKGMPMQ